MYRSNDCAYYYACATLYYVCGTDKSPNHAAIRLPITEMQLTLTNSWKSNDKRSNKKQSPANFTFFKGALQYLDNIIYSPWYTAVTLHSYEKKSAAASPL